MSTKEGRNFRMKLYIPPEASNIIHDGDKEQFDKISLKRISIAKEKRIPALTRVLEPSFYESFYFLHIAAPVESKSCGASDKRNCLKSVIARINKMTPAPKFIVFCGGFMDVGDNRSDRNLSKKKDLIEETLEGLNSKIRVVCVPTVDDFKNKANIQDVEDYRSVYGDDWYGFWVCGVSFMTINSLYYQQGIESSLEVLKTEQEDWMDSELLQQQVFCAQWTIIFQDSLAHVEEDNLGKGQNIGLLNKYTQAGATHVFCRQFDETLTSHRNFDNMEIVGHCSNKHPNKDWGVILVRVTRDKVEHTSFPLNELPETVDL